jgi:competence protein ComGC
MSTPPQPSKAATPRAFTVTELMIVIACLAALAAILLPAWAKRKIQSSRVSCCNNLKQIGLASRVWAIDNHDRFPMQVSVTNGGTMELAASGAVYPHFQVMSNELSTPIILLCPNEKKRAYATNFLGLWDNNLSYFINLDARNADGSSLLCGDRNITNRPPAGSRLVSLTEGDTIAWTKDLHVKKGWLGFGDGSVSFFENGKVGAAVRIGNGTTNRLGVP